MHFGACMDGAPHTHVPDACEHAQMWGPFCAQGGSPHQTVVAGQAAASDEGTRRLALLGLAASRHQRQAGRQLASQRRAFPCRPPCRLLFGGLRPASGSRAWLLHAYRSVLSRSPHDFESSQLLPCSEFGPLSIGCCNGSLSSSF